MTVLRCAGVLAAGVMWSSSVCLAATETDCAAQWQKKDLNGDNILTNDEDAQSFVAAMEEKKISVKAPGQLTRDEFLTHCKTDVFASAAAGKPVEPADKPYVPDGNKTGAVTAPNSALIAGANSFTEGQARSRIEEWGYSEVGALKKDANGIWRGSASKDGRSVNIGLDYQGTVAAN